MSRQMTGAEMVVQALKDQGVDTVFGYPGGAVLPIYDALFQQNDIRHILVRHEQGAATCRRGLRPLDRQARRRAGHLRSRRHQRRHRHDRRADGFDPDRRPHRPGADLHDRQRRLPGGRHRRHHPALHQAQLAGEGHRQARRDHPPGLPRRHQRPARPGAGRHPQGRPVRHRRLHRARGGARQRTTSRAPRATPTPSSPRSRRWRRPSGRSSTPAAASSTPAPRPAGSCASWPMPTGFPVTSTLMGLGAYPAIGKALDRHARHARHLRGQLGDARLRRDDLHRRPLRRPHHRPDRRLLARHSNKIHIDIDPSSINKNIHVDVPIVGDVASVLDRHAGALEGARVASRSTTRLGKWWDQIERWRGRNCLAYRNSDKIIKPQYALERLEALTRRRDRYITTEVGQHQMWAAQYLQLRRAEPLDDLRRPRHHGLRPARLDRRADRPSRRAGHQRRRRGVAG